MSKKMDSFMLNFVIQGAGQRLISSYLMASNLIHRMVNFGSDSEIYYQTLRL